MNDWRTRTSPLPRQLTGDQASNLMASLTVEDSDATTILAALAGPIQAAHAHHEEHRLQAM